MRMANPSATLEQLVADSGWLRRLAVALVKDEAAADDLVQDTYSIAATEAPTDGRPIRPWLARVLWNRVRMTSRSARRRRTREQAFGELAAAPARPDEIVGRIELQRRLAGLVLELPTAQRDVLLLHYFEGLTSSQIGQRLGISPGTVRWRLKQAVDELRVRLDEREPNRAWVPAFAAFARRAPSAKIALLPKLLIAAAVLLAIFGFVLRAQLGEANQPVPIRSAVHALAPPPELPALDVPSSPGRDIPAPGADQVFGAETRPIKGIVIDGSGHGVEGADVVLHCGYTDDGSAPARRTGADGTFAFDVDPHCRFTIIATKGDARGEQSWLGPMSILARGRAGDLIEGGLGPLDIKRLREHGVTVQLRPLAQAVVRVVDAETGAPIANARVSSAWTFDDGTSAVTGSDGIARVNVSLPSRIAVAADRYAAAHEVIDNPKPPLHDRTALLLGAGSSIVVAAQVRLDIRLDRGIAVSGAVVGPDAKPIAGARVALSGPLGAARISDAIATSDASGTFAANVPLAGRYALKAERRDLSTEGVVIIEVPVEGRTNVVAHVVPRGEIRGTVVDLGSRPVAGARVSVADGSVRPVISDPQGRFVIERVLGAVDLIANRAADASAFQHLQVKPGERADVVLQIGPSGISGIAVDHDGAPVEGAQVWLNACCAASPNLIRGTRYTTNATGTFSFDTPRGNFVLSVRRYADDDYEDEDDLEVTGGSRDVRLVVP